MSYLTPILAFGISLLFTPVVRHVTRSKGWVAQPVKDRWHKTPTPLFGGIAIYLGLAVPLFFHADFASLIPHLVRTENPVSLPSFTAAVFAGMTLLFVLGLMDDFIHIKPHTKLVGQILVASFVTFLGFRFHWFESLTLDTLVTIVWIVGITNAFNLLDNMDGLCAGIGALAAIYLAFLFAGRSPEAQGVALALTGALGGFLIYNFNPASIFMGDCGSLAIGFTASMLCLHYPERLPANPLSAYAVPIFVLMVPIFDTTMVTLIRLLSGRKASVGGKDHTSHRLVLLGLSERDAVLFLYGIGAISGLSALFVSRNDTLTSPVVIIPLAVSILLMGYYLSQLRIYPEREFSLLRGRPYTPILVELTYKRQLGLVLLDFCLMTFAYYLSYRLRFDSKAFPYYFTVFLRSLPAVIACKFIAFFTMGIYRGIWRYMSVNDVLVHLKASFLATLFSVAAVTYIYRFTDFSKGIFVIDWFLTTGFLLGTRGSFRLFVDMIRQRAITGDTVMIYGAGRGGEILLREILNNPRLYIKPAGFIDDDPIKTGRKLQGYPILGTFESLESLLDRHRISGLLISFNHADPERLSHLKRFCKEHRLFLKQFSICLEAVELED